MVNLGVSLLAAHLFVLYSAMLSSITPPVALAAYAAASISNGNPLKIAVLACKFGMAAFAVPYFFAYDPAILGIEVTWFQMAISFVSAILGGICASAAMLGYFTDKLNILDRLLFAVIAFLFMNSDWRIDFAALAFLLALVWWVKPRPIGHQKLE